MLRDLRFALHLIVKDRWYSAVAIIALALGIGVNATVFTLVNAILIRGLPYKDSAKLYMLSSQRLQGGRSGVSPLDLTDWKEQAKSFTGLAAFSGTGGNISDDRAAPQSVRAMRLSANVFSLLGQQPLFGRDFAPGDDAPGAERVVLLGYGVWKNRYGDDRSIIGKTLRIDGKPATIVGVMPEGMMFPSSAEMWIPLVPTPEDKRSSRYLSVFGRLRDDVSRTQAQTELDGIAGRLATAYPDTNKDYAKVSVETFAERFNGGEIRTVMLAMMGAVSFVLLIACANVANLLLSRSVHRSREIAVRIALGATRWRVVRQLLIESICLGVMGGAIGLGLAMIGVRLFDRAVEGSGKPYWVVFTFDATVFSFLAAICVLTGIIFGLAPALQVTKTNVNEVLKEGGRGNAGGVRARWLTGTMVVLELALTLVLLVGAGLMIRSFMKLYTLDLGIKTDNLLTIGLGLSNTKYPNADARRAFYDNFAAPPGGDSRRAVRRVHDQRAALRNRPPPVRAGRRAGAGARRGGAAGQHGHHQSGVLRDGRRAVAPRTDLQRERRQCRRRDHHHQRAVRRGSLQERGSDRKTDPVRAAAAPSRSAGADTGPAGAGLAHHCRHQSDHPSREPAGRGADRRDLHPAPPGALGLHHRLVRRRCRRAA